MDKCFKPQVLNILKTAEKEMIELRHPYVGTEHLLLSLLKNNKIKSLCYKYNLTYHNFKKELINIIGVSNKKSEYILYTPLLKLVIDNAYNKSFKENREMDEISLLSSLLSEQDGIAIRIVNNMGVDIDSIVKEIGKPKLLSELGVNLNDINSSKIYLRDKEIEDIISILIRKNKNNPILVGHSGTGKTAIVEEIARRLKKGLVPDLLKGYNIISINTSSLIAGTKYRGEFESRINNLIKEVIDYKNIILFIDEIHTIVKTGSSDGSIDAANILKPYLARGDIKVIGATTYEEYSNYIKKDSALTRRFTPVIINEPSLSEMSYIMQRVKKSYEDYYNIRINKKMISYLLELSDKYLPNLYNPDKSIEVLDTICSKKVLDNKNNIITKDDIFNSIAGRVNLIKYNNQEFINTFNNLNNLYDKGKVNIIKDIIINNKTNNILDSSYLDIINYIADNLNINLINIDCHEYSDEYSLNRLLSNNYLYNLIEENPYSFIVFNNYNDVNKVLYNIINTMINNKYIRNNNNEKIYLNNSIIFMISSEEIKKLGFNNNLLFT